jgi:hypothetical protein
MKQLKGSISFMDIEVVHTIDMDVEASLHVGLSDYRVKGEWFDLTDVQIENIKTFDFKSLFTDEDIVSIYVGDRVYITLVRSAMEDMAKLSGGGKNLFVHLYKNMGLNKTIFYFNKWDYMTKLGINSVKVVDAYIKELEDACMMQKSHKTNWYWANPKYLYRGSEKHLLSMKFKSILTKSNGSEQ